MRSIIEKTFLNETFVLVVIIVNALIIFAQESDVNSLLLDGLDIACTIFFVVEIIIKMVHYGPRNYLKDYWNIFDVVVVAVSLPSLVPAWNNIDSFQALRTLRILKFFRTLRFFPDFSVIAQHFGVAMKKTFGILCSLLLFIFITALICCSLLKTTVPQYFGSVWDSIYTIFRMFTIEGWYEIPDAIAAATTYMWGMAAKVVFSLLLIFGGIIGMSLINSIFVDEMVSDNNDDVKQQLRAIEEKLDKLSEKLKE